MSLSSARSTAEQKVVAALNDPGPTSQFVIADITCDDAWITITASDAPVIDDWR